MARCQPAPFGVGRKTYHDRRVRDGAQLLARDGALRGSGLDLNGTGILTETRRTLCPDDEQNPDAELYAVNVYGARGHFVAHKDTPRDPDVFGTRVVCLPVPFRGGGLVLQHGSIRRFEWEAADSFGFGQRDDTYPVHWAAFFSDVDHEIEPVTDGTRVTLTWLLRRGATGAPIPRQPAASEVDLEAEFAAALANPRFLPSRRAPRHSVYAPLHGSIRTRAFRPDTFEKLGRRRSRVGIGSSPLPHFAAAFVHDFDLPVRSVRRRELAAHAHTVRS